MVFRYASRAFIFFGFITLTSSTAFGIVGGVQNFNSMANFDCSVNDSSHFIASYDPVSGDFLTGTSCDNSGLYLWSDLGFGYDENQEYINLELDENTALCDVGGDSYFTCISYAIDEQNMTFQDQVFGISGSQQIVSGLVVDTSWFLGSSLLILVGVLAGLLGFGFAVSRIKKYIQKKKA